MPDTLSRDALARHLVRILPQADVVPLTALREHLYVGCVDGRRSACVAGAPGGNAGLLVRLLSVWEEATGRTLDEAAMERVFTRYLDHFDAFYLHTDGVAQEALARHLGVDLSQVDGLLRVPPEAWRATLMEALLIPTHMGCGHLRLLLEHPEVYGTRRRLTEGVIRGFFSRLWEGDPRLHLDILSGIHQEQAVVQLQMPRSGRLVTIHPRYEDTEFFVYHPDAEAYLEELHARFLAGTEKMGEAEIPAAVEAQRLLGERQLRQTLARLAAGLPVYRVRLAAHEGEVPTVTEIRGMGTVPPLDGSEKG